MRVVAAAALLAACGGTDLPTGTWDSPTTYSGQSMCSWLKHTAVGVSIFWEVCGETIHCSEVLGPNAGNLGIEVSTAGWGRDVPIVVPPLDKTVAGAVVHSSVATTTVFTDTWVSGSVSIDAQGTMASGSFLALGSGVDPATTSCPICMPAMRPCQCVSGSFSAAPFCE